MRRWITAWCVFVLWILVPICAFSADYTGDYLLTALGTTKNSNLYKEFKDWWQLDKQLENTNRGIKVYVNEVNEKVETILISGYGAGLEGIRFAPFNAQLPYNISLEDDTAALAKKLGEGEKLIGKESMRFYQDHNVIEVNYNSLKDGKITWLKFSLGSKPEVKPAEPEPERKNKIEEARNSEISKFEVKPAKAEEKKIPDGPPFKSAILEVFRASHESGFYAIKNGDRTKGNFWNYKYAYNTKLKVPGEKYNMLYSFPFINSQLDFVVVLKEADEYDKTFAEVYHRFEKQLLNEFTTQEGWTSECLPGKSSLPNIEVKNEGYGSVILAYSKNPKGRCVLFLRFLFYSSY